MDSPTEARVLIEVESHEPLSGRAGFEGAATEPFSGWMGLSALLDRLLTRAGENDEGDTPRNG
jgi:hypothetical protein